MSKPKWFLKNLLNILPYVPCGLKRSQGHWLALCTDAQLWFDKIFSPLNCVKCLWSRLFLKVLHNGKLLWHGVKNSIWQKNCWSWIKSGEELWEWIFREIVQCGGEIIGKTMRSSPQVKIEKTLAFQQVGLIVFIFDIHIMWNMFLCLSLKHLQVEVRTNFD